jgi:hypothetical protein
VKRKPCSCYIPRIEGHDFDCRQHPRFKKRKPITDTMRLNKLLKVIQPRWYITRRDIDTMVRADRVLR